MNYESATAEELESRAESEAAVAELLAVLSDATEAPRGVPLPNTQLVAGEVNFGTSDWMTKVIDLQGWLRPADRLVLGHPQQFVEDLARALVSSHEQPEILIDAGSSHPRLSVAGLDRLRTRCDRAVRLQAEFLADMEGEGGTIAAATRLWIEAWDEASELEQDEGSGPVTAKTHVWPIQDLSDKAKRGKLNLSPSYQRGDVWPTTDSQMLIESILRGIPLPSVIILRPKNQLEAPFEVVDGKQRLTSILRFIGQHPSALSRVAEMDREHPGMNLEWLFRNDYPAFKRAWKKLTGELLGSALEREYYFPYKLRTNVPALSGALEGLQGKYYSQIRELPIEVADDWVEVRQIFETASDYKIPVIEYSRATRRQIHEVFNLYNKQGKHLNAEEIRNALFHDVALMRGLLIAAGDNAANDPAARAEVAPFLAPVWPELETLGHNLKAYGFGTSRYRRTKVLSWIAASMLNENPDPDPRLPSTARHIDSMLQRIEEHGPLDQLGDEAAAADLLRFIADVVHAHSTADSAWAPRFKDNSTGRKWQELQLVGSLVGVGLATAQFGDAALSRILEQAAQLHRTSGDDRWKRPSKTQTTEQWRYVARIALWVADLLGTDLLQADANIRSRFGASAVPTLRAIYAHDPLTLGLRGGPNAVAPEL